jgi:hypothetical protein
MIRRLLVLILFAGLSGNSLRSQCWVGVTQPASWYLPDGTSPNAWADNIDVGFLMPAVNPNVWQGVDDGIQSWNNASESSGNGSGVYLFQRYDFPLNVGVTYPTGCHYPDCPYVLEPAVQISSIAAENMGTHAGESSFAYSYFGSSEEANNGVGLRIEYAYIDLNDAINDQSYATFIMAHELGHSFGLRDCYTCAYGSTIMSSGQYALNEAGTPQQPTQCDNDQVSHMFP